MTRKILRCPKCGAPPGTDSFEPRGRAHGGTTLSGCDISAFRRYKRDAVALWNRKVKRARAPKRKAVR